MLTILLQGAINMKVISVYFKVPSLISTSSISAFLLSVFLISTFFTATTTFANENQLKPPSTVNINTADAATISKALKGIGISKAKAIIAYRETYGAFHAIEELEAVKGIGKNTLEKNKGRVVVE